MTKWLPIEVLKTCRLDEVKAPGILFDERGKPQFLIYGKPALAVFIGEEHKGDAFLAEQGANWRGVAVEGIEVQVDFASLGSTFTHDLPKLAIVREADTIGIAYRGRDSHGITQTKVASYQVGNREREANQAAQFYTRWRAVYRDGHELIELFEKKS